VRRDRDRAFSCAFSLVNVNDERSLSLSLSFSVRRSFAFTKPSSLRRAARRSKIRASRSFSRTARNNVALSPSLELQSSPLRSGRTLSPRDEKRRFRGSRADAGAHAIVRLRPSARAMERGEERGGGVFGSFREALVHDRRVVSQRQLSWTLRRVIPAARVPVTRAFSKAAVPFVSIRGRRGTFSAF